MVLQFYSRLDRRFFTVFSSRRAFDRRDVSLFSKKIYIRRRGDGFGPYGMGLQFWSRLGFRFFTVFCPRRSCE